MESIGCKKHQIFLLLSRWKDDNKEMSIIFLNVHVGNYVRNVINKKSKLIGKIRKMIFIPVNTFDQDATSISAGKKEHFNIKAP